MEWKCYIIYNKHYSYVGATNNTENRLKKHNQELPGGAKYTKMIGKGWKYICIIEGFKNKIDCLRFEWAVKHEAPRNHKGIFNRLLKLEKVLNKEQWTSKSPSSINYNLKLIWYELGFILDDIELPSYIEQDIID